MREEIIKILNRHPLVISQSRRSDSNGLRNADEIADKIMGVINKKNKKLARTLRFYANKLNYHPLPLTNSSTPTDVILDLGGLCKKHRLPLVKQDEGKKARATLKTLEEDL